MQQAVHDYAFRRRNLYLALLVLGLSLMIYSCVPPQEEVTIPVFDYQPSQDTFLQKMILWESEAKIDQIVPQLQSENINYVYQAVKCLSNPKFAAHIEAVQPFLRSPEIELAAMAAYAIGQSGLDSLVPDLIAAYDVYDSSFHKIQLTTNILTAIGKCGGASELDLLSSIKTFEPRDTALLLAQINGLLALGLKGIKSEASAACASERIVNPDYPLAVRIHAAYYLNRLRDLPLEQERKKWEAVCNTTTNEPLRFQLLQLLIKHNASIDFLKSEVQKLNNKGYRSAIIASILNNKSSSGAYARSLLKDSDPYVSELASSYFIEHGNPDLAFTFEDMLEGSKLSPSTRLNLAISVAKNVPFYYSVTKEKSKKLIKELLLSESNPYKKARMIQRCANYFELLDMILELYDKDQPNTINVAVVQAAFVFAKSVPNKGAGLGYRKKVLAFCDRIIKANESSTLTELAYQMRQDYSLELRKAFSEKGQLARVLDDMNPSEDLEKYTEVNALLWMLGDSSHSKSPDLNFRPIDLTLFKRINSSTKVIIETNKGNMEWKLDPISCPIASTNFVRLAMTRFFDGQYIHRYVPGFVIQSGSPKGDSYASVPYINVAELMPRLYDEAGKLGMASIGPNTENSQWFMTLAPTDHLNGRYTQFGELVQGEKVLMDLQAGDQIKSIRIENLNH